MSDENFPPIEQSCINCTFICPLLKHCEYDVNGSNWTYYTEIPENEAPSRTFIIFETITLIVLGIIIVLGNLACIITFVRTQSLRKRSSYLIVNLAVADLFVGFVDFMAIQFFKNSYSTYTESTDKFHVMFLFCDLLTGLASILSLSFIAVYRCLSAVSPLRHRSMDTLWYSLFIVFPWFIATMASLFQVITCTVCYSIYIYCIVSIPLLGVLVIITCYVFISYTIKQSCKASNRTRALRDRKINVTLMIVTLASLLTWGPYQCFASVSMFCTKCKIPMHALFGIKLLQYLNSGLNIFIYIARMPHFKRAFVAIFYPQKCLSLRSRMRNRIRVRPVAVIGTTYNTRL